MSCRETDLSVPKSARSGRIRIDEASKDEKSYGDLV